MNKKIPYLLLFAICIQNLTNSYGQETKYYLENSAQVGFEYDSNVFKTYLNESGDFLTKLLFQSKSGFWVAPDVLLGWDYQGGGKKFIHDDAQDQLIQNIDLPIHLLPTKHFRILLEPNLKYQNERDKIDLQTTDVNEDFISTNPLLKLTIIFPHGFYLQPEGSFTYFHFFPDETFSYTREEFGASFEKRMKDWVVGVDYEYYKQQFGASFRKDSVHEISPYFQFSRNPFVSLSYSYQTNNSNATAFSFENHKISLLTSFLFGKMKNASSSQPEAKFSLHFIGTLQLKDYSSVLAETPEGIRYLVTSSEEENFNNLVAKFNYHFHKRWTLETKYTRISNDLTNQQIKFSRSLYYAGLRYDF